MRSINVKFQDLKFGSQSAATGSPKRIANLDDCDEGVDRFGSADLAWSQPTPTARGGHTYYSLRPSHYGCEGHQG